YAPTMSRERVSIAARNERGRNGGSIAASEASEERTERCAERTSRSGAVEPDVLTLAKALGGGLPLGAMLAFGSAADLFQPGSHGSTFGGNPVSCAAALAVIDTIVAEDLLGRAKQIGAFVAEGITALGHPLFTGVRGEGALMAIILSQPQAGELEAELRTAGYLVNAVAPDAIRLAPPLIVTDDQLGAFLDALAATTIGSRS
ncbi:MAG: aminotransferase class III-fold pyridoxal phosphate-dependent enzyme, partial [Geodermatophilaceae bacterium]|nr:aminotransferase class III-fold pyridoxal phosphate-dependent enzyme [Geodermatophilaceae bacterium]